MVKGKKISKKQLKEPDEFITVTERVFLFARVHLKPILGGLVVILAMIAGFFLFQMWEKAKEEEASKAYGVALELYERGIVQAREGTPPDYKGVYEKFDEISRKYSGTTSGKLALLNQGNLLHAQGDFDGAIKAFTDFLEKKGKERFFRYLALKGLAQAHEGKKEYEKALEAYQKMVEISEGNTLASAHLSIGYCYEKLGKTKEAVEHFRAFLNGQQKSPMTHAIQRKVALLEKS